MSARAKTYVREGYARIQVKVGDDPIEDVERMRAVRAVVPKHVLLLADANGAWRVDGALRFLAGMGEADYYLEQPCMTLAEIARVRPACRQPLLLDESITRLEDLLEAHARGPPRAGTCSGSSTTRAWRPSSGRPGRGTPGARS